MSCGLDKERLTGYFDGELESTEHLEIEKHIAGCSECLRDLEEIKSVALSVRGLPRFAVPRTVTEGVIAEVARGSAEVRPQPRSWLPWALTAAAAVFVAVNVVYLTRLPKQSIPAEVAVQPPKLPPRPPAEELHRLEAAKSGKDETVPSPAESTRKADAGPDFFSVTSAEIGEARAKVEEELQNLGVSISVGAGEYDQSAHAKDTCIEIELTDEELALLAERLRNCSTLLRWEAGAQEYRRRGTTRSAKKGGDLKEKKDEGGAGSGGRAFSEPSNDDREKDPSGGGEKQVQAQQDKEPETKPSAAGSKKRVVIYFHELLKK